MRAVSVVVNRREHSVKIDDRLSLADFLRNELGLLGTNLGCEHGSCGSCTVLVDGRSIRSCLELAARVDGATIVTVEGLADEHGGLHPLQQAFASHHGLQCGFCTPGFLMAALEYVDGDGPDDEAHVRRHLSGNLCRCTGYEGIVDAVLEVVRVRHTES